MFDPETFIDRVAEHAMAPRVRVGDYVRVNPDEPAADDRLVAVRDPRARRRNRRQAPHRAGRAPALRALDERCPRALCRRRQRHRHPGRQPTSELRRSDHPQQAAESARKAFRQAVESSSPGGDVGSRNRGTAYRFSDSRR